MSDTDGLTAQVKRKLNITWSDEDTDARVADIIKTAAAHLRFMLGIEQEDFKFEDPGIENLLFLAYCFYEWNHAADEFEKNYLGLILQARSKYEVAQYSVEEGGNDDESE